MSKDTIARILASAFVATCALSMTACSGEEAPDNTSDAVDAAQDATDHAADHAEDMADDVDDAVEDAGH